MRVGRNETCPCGSGKKYKSCCEGKASRGPTLGLMLLVGAIAAIALVGLIALMTGRNEPAPTLGPASSSSARPAQPQPPGPVPPGKVWSAEHGHWHDAAPGRPAAAAPPPAQVAFPTTPQPQPPGPAPAGKVWSAEHGHWHDAPR